MPFWTLHCKYIFGSIVNFYSTWANVYQTWQHHLYSSVLFKKVPKGHYYAVPFNWPFPLHFKLNSVGTPLFPPKYSNLMEVPGNSGRIRDTQQLTFNSPLPSLARFLSLRPVLYHSICSQMELQTCSLPSPCNSKLYSFPLCFAKELLQCFSPCRLIYKKIQDVLCPFDSSGGRNIFWDRSDILS